MVEIGCFDQGRRLRRQARGQARAHHENLAMGAGRPFDRPATGLEQGQVVSAGRIRRQAGAIVGGPAGQNFLKGEIGLVFLGARQVVLVLAGLNACARILEVTEREIAETELIKDHRPLKRLALEIFDVLAGEIRACQFRGGGHQRRRFRWLERRSATAIEPSAVGPVRKPGNQSGHGSTPRCVGPGPVRFRHKGPGPPVYHPSRRSIRRAGTSRSQAC